jgi:hypothetical protein
MYPLPIQQAEDLIRRISCWIDPNGPLRTLGQSMSSSVKFCSAPADHLFMRNSLFGRSLALLSCVSMLLQGWTPSRASTPEFGVDEGTEMSDADGEALIRRVAGEAARLHSIGKYQVGFQDQRGFAPIEKLWGVGLSLVGPMDSKTGVRPNIGVYDMELENVHFEHEELKKETETYYQKRKEWLANQEGAKWKRALPYEVIHNDENRVDGYRIGFEYEMGGVSQVQMSYFLMCNRRMFHLKSLYASEKASTDGVALAKVAESFHCSADAEKVGVFDRKEISEFWKKAKSTPGGRAQALEALREFFLQYEVEHQNIDEDDSEFEARLDRVRDLIESAFGIQSAFAQDAGDSCFFAGWRSSWTKTSKGKRICAEPAGLKNCGEGQLACNPGIFGNVCISDDFRQQATQVCHAEYLREASKHDQEIANIQESNPGVFQEVQEAADGLCSSEPYASSNYSLCTSLYKRIQQINPESGAGSTEREPPGMDPTNYDEAYDTTQDLLQLVENHCMTPDKKEMYASVVVEGQVVDCVKARETALKNLRQLDQVKADTNFQEIKDQACEVIPPSLKILKDTTANMESKVEPSCSEAEKAKRGNCGKDLLCAAAASAATIVTLGIPIKVGSCDTHRDSCLVNAATAILKSLWETVKGLISLVGKTVSGLASDAYRGAKNLTKGFLNFFGASYKIDDASSYKTVQFAKSAGGLIGDFIKNPGESINKFMGGIWKGINQWMMEDAFCQQWSGVAHMSTCLKPSTGWSCLSCKEALNGACTVVGYLASEIAAAFFTGGAAAAIKMTGVGAKVASLLGKMSKAGKMSKFGLAQKFPKLMKATKAVSKVIGKGGKMIGTVAKVTGKAAGKAGIFALKVFSGGAKKIISLLEKIPLAKTAVKVVKLGGQQGKKFVKWYAELNRKAFAAGSNFFRGPTKAGTKLAKMEAGGAAVMGAERRLAQDAGEAANELAGDMKALPPGPEKKAFDAEKAGARLQTSRANLDRAQSELESSRLAEKAAQEKVNGMKKGAAGYDEAKSDLLKKKKATKNAEKEFKKWDNNVNQQSAAIRRNSPEAKRVEMAEGLLGRKVSAEQSKALDEAHRVGAGEVGANGGPAGLGNYTKAQLKKKAEILEKSGFSEAERRMLIESEAVGSPAGPVGDLGSTDPLSQNRMDAAGGSITSPANDEFISASQARILKDGRAARISGSDLRVGDAVMLSRSKGGTTKAVIIRAEDDGTVLVRWTDSNGKIIEKMVPSKELELLAPVKKPGALGRLGDKVKDKWNQAKEKVKAALNPNPKPVSPNVPVGQTAPPVATDFYKGINRAQEKLVSPLGLKPSITIDRLGTKLTATEPFIVNGRTYAWVVVENGGKKSIRLAYKSQSQGVFRMADGVDIDGSVTGIKGWLSKGKGEEFMSVDPEMQEVLLKQSEGKNLKTLSEQEAIHSIEKASPDRFGLYHSEEKIKATDALRTSERPELKTRNSNYTMRDPKDVVISSENLKPDFTKPKRTFTTTTDTSGEVQAYVYESKDKSVEYLVYRDKEDKIWFADVVTKNSPINKYGVRSAAYNFRELTTPRWEYTKQIPEKFLDEIEDSFGSMEPIPHPTKKQYSSSWKYLKEIPEVKNWYRSNGIPIPE